MIACHSALNVCQQLLVSIHHLEIVWKLKVDLDHLFERFEAPLAFVVALEIQHLLEWHQCILRWVLLQCFAVVVLILEIDVRLGVAVLGILLKNKRKMMLRFFTISKCRKKKVNFSQFQPNNRQLSHQSIVFLIFAHEIVVNVRHFGSTRRINAWIYQNSTNFFFSIPKSSVRFHMST